MTQNTRMLFCSRDMHTFMEANEIDSIPELFSISIEQLVTKSDFPYRLLSEWVLLRDKYNFLHEN